MVKRPGARRMARYAATMDGIAPRGSPLPQWVPRPAFDLARYERMAHAGILGPEPRVELIEGELVAMPPQGAPHIGAVMALLRLLIGAADGRGEVIAQATLRLGDYGAPEPDVMLLRPRTDRYRTSPPPGAGDVTLLIEVADSSLRYDREVKGPLYARHGIAEYWIVDLDGAGVTLHRGPKPEGYAAIRVARAGESLDLPGLPGARIAVADILG
jgi:Uma2 family endonuclease